MVGIEVNKQTIDVRAGEAILAVRHAFDLVENVAKWLANEPSSPDTLIDVYGYTADEAYLLRLVFGNLDSIRTANLADLETARKLTGLS